MTPVGIQWIPVSLELLGAADNTWLYAISRGKALLYIGQAHGNNTAAHEVKANIYRLKLNGGSLRIWLGYLYVEKGRRVTKRLASDVENLLVFEHQPSRNTQLMGAYTGRPDLRVLNLDCPLLKRRVGYWGKK